MTVHSGMESLEIVKAERAKTSRIWAATIGLVVFYMSIGLALRYPVDEAKVPVSGDEQHYLTQAVSLLSDGDLVVFNNYDQGDYLVFYSNRLDPSLWNLSGNNGYSGHSPGVGVAVAPGLWVAGWVGVLATLAIAMGATFAITAATLARLRGGSLPTAALLLLASGFAALPLLPYSHTLYPETFMALVIAALALLTVIHFQASLPSHRTAAALAAISVSGLSIALHPKYVAVLLGVTVFYTVFELYDSSRSPEGARLAAALSYIVVAGLWLILFSWFHGIMWDEFHPAGWWLRVRSAMGVGPGRAIVQLLDLFFGREHGLFPLAPLTLLAVAFLAVVLRRGSVRLEHRVGVFVVVVAGSIAGLAAYSEDWHAGDSPLGRYITPLVPILLLTGVYVALRWTWSTGRRGYLAIVVGLGVVQGLTYTAVPMLFRPQAEGGSGILAVIADRVGALADVESWFWSANNSTSWAGLIYWTVMLGLTLWLFARTDEPRVPGAPETSQGTVKTPVEPPKVETQQA